MVGNIRKNAPDKKSAKVALPALNPADWKVHRVRDCETRRLYLRFDFPIGSGNRMVMTFGNETELRKIRTELAKYTSGLNTTAASAFVSDLIQNAPTEELRGTKKGGWKPDAFVTPFWVETENGVFYHWLGEAPVADYRKGTKTQWRRMIAKQCSSSNYLVLAVEIALAAPLLKFANLSESATFHLNGRDSTGKTTAAKVCQSVLGPPESILQWSSSARRFEEDGAERNDLPMVLNAAEHATKERLKVVLALIVHGLSEGKSSTRSRVVQDSLPDETWRTVILSTGNSSGRELAKKAGLSWDGQDDVRFITIPVPPPAEAGIFDRLKGTPEERRARGVELVRSLEQALPENHGVVFRRWIRELMKKDASARVRKLIKRFVDNVEPDDAHERRIAKKFGLLYAAGKIAVDKKLLPWDRNLPLSATTRLYRRAISQEIHPGSFLKEDMRALAKAVRNKELCPRVPKGKALEVDGEGAVIGGRTEQNGKPIIALLHDGLAVVVPDPQRRDALLRHLRLKGALKVGHGGKATQQLALPARVNGKLVSRPRYLILDAKTFAKVAGAPKEPKDRPRPNRG